MIMKSAVLKNGKAVIVEKEVPSLETKKGAIIKVKGCGLCGSDIVKIDCTKSDDEEKVSLGHEIVGEIVDINENITGNFAKAPFKKGDIVAMGHHYPCFSCKYCSHGNYSMCETFKKSNIHPGGFSEYIYADLNHLKYTVFKKPDNLSEAEFSFLEPLSCCIRAIRRAGVELNKDNSNFNALVIGLGSIGILMSQGLKAFGANAFGLDINEKRQEFVKKFGIVFNKNIKYDAVFMTSGSSSAIKTAMDFIDYGGKIIVFSSVKNQGEYQNNEIYYRELEILGSYSPSPDDIRISYEFLSENKTDVRNLSTFYPLEQLNQAIADTKTGKILKGYITI